MPQRQRPEDDREPHIETPVIDMQDLEHKAGPQSRVSNKGVKIEPTIGSLGDRDLSKEDELALEALEEFEKSIRNQPPG